MSCTLLTGIQTCALPIFVRNDIAPHPGDDVGAALSQAYVPLLCFAVILIKTNGRIFSDGLCRVHSVVTPRPAAPPPTWASLNSESTRGVEGKRGSGSEDLGWSRCSRKKINSNKTT